MRIVLVEDTYYKEAMKAIEVVWPGADVELCTGEETGHIPEGRTAITFIKDQCRGSRRRSEIDLLICDAFIMEYAGRDMPAIPNEHLPHGLLAAAAGYSNHVPTYVITSEDHHGEKLNYFNSLWRSLQLPEFIDNIDKSDVNSWIIIFNEIKAGKHDYKWHLDAPYNRKPQGV